MSFAEAKADFEFVNALPGQKIILKGNHDYWWATMNKMNAFFAENGFDTLHILHNNHYLVEGVCICGSRGWLFDQGEPDDQKVIAREAGRLEASILSAGDIPEERVVFLHYPPVYGEQLSPEILEVLLGTRSAAAIMDTSMVPGAAMPLMATIWGSSFGSSQPTTWDLTRSALKPLLDPGSKIGVFYRFMNKT